MIGVRELLLIGAGGAAGSICRYLVSHWAQRLMPLAFPLGTLVVNVSGSLLIGLIAGLAGPRELIGAAPRLFLVVGLLGGFTTFSAFSLETVMLVREGQAVSAVLNAFLQVGLSIAAAFAGLAASRLI